VERNLQQCNGKKRYRDKREAMRFSHMRQSSANEPAEYLRVYECPRCWGWHLTKKPLVREVGA